MVELADNDNQSALQRALDPDRMAVQVELQNVLANWLEQGIDPRIVCESLFDAGLQTLRANPYRDPVDVGAVKADLCALNDMHGRTGFLIEQLQKALRRDHNGE